MNRASVLRVGIGILGVILLAALPLLNLRIPGVLPGATYEPGTLQLLALCLLIAGLALSYHVLFGLAGLLSFGHALYFAAGLYGLAIALRHWQMSLVSAALLVFVGATLLALIVGAVSLRVSGISFAMVTLAFAQAGSVLVARNPGGLTGGEEGLGLDITNIPESFVGVVNTRNLYWISLAIAIAVFALVTWFERSRAGHVAAATRENELRVRVIGMQPYLVRLLAFVTAGSLAGIVGMAYLLVQNGAQARATSADFTLTLLVMVVLGGVGSRWGAVIGGVVYTLLDQRLTALAGGEFIQSLPAILRVPLSQPLFLLGTLFILVVLFLPGGITGTVARLRSGGSVARARATLEQAGGAESDGMEVEAR
ncbi:branched-chain amino acid ABC transporter permease [Occultella glacieicola]|uniref:Branched-chain amino acid ABC transporter permease n=1 Tax=Occultella glacieicola TaxID=2518684 RepID=A0ABY2DZ07_9MICO|nr:branched-chain amino acid ABC transporter permease [Occultella glacieicola]TDE89934.1 branched-chain amino acid ABC transporter permease [Occultella glacieicola]